MFMLKLCELAVLNDAATPYEMKILLVTHHNDGIGSKPLPHEFVTWEKQKNKINVFVQILIEFAILTK